MSTTFYGHKIKKSDIFEIVKYLKQISTDERTWLNMVAIQKQPITMNIYEIETYPEHYIVTIAGVGWSIFNKDVLDCYIVEPFCYDDRSDMDDEMLSIADGVELCFEKKEKDEYFQRIILSVDEASYLLWSNYGFDIRDYTERKAK